jgi:hypothetical protein
MRVQVYHTHLPPTTREPCLNKALPPHQPLCFLFFILLLGNLLHLKQVCLIRENLHKILIITVIYKFNVFTDEPGSLDSE